MDPYLLVDETIRIAWQGDKAGPTLEKLMREGAATTHFSADGETTLLIHWGNVRSVRFDKYGERLTS